MATAASRLYYDSARPTAFSTLRKLGVALKNKLDNIRDWLEKQDAYTLHRRIRKRFARYPYTVINVMESGNATCSKFGLLSNLTIITNIFYPSLMYFPNFYICSM